MTKAQATEIFRDMGSAVTLVCIDGIAALRGTAQVPGVSHCSAAVARSAFALQMGCYVQAMHRYHANRKTTLGTVRQGLAKPAGIDAAGP